MIYYSGIPPTHFLFVSDFDHIPSPPPGNMQVHCFIITQYPPQSGAIPVNKDKSVPVSSRQSTLQYKRVKWDRRNKERVPRHCWKKNT